MREEYNEFDFLVKSLLEDAEVKPSRGVWKKVADELNARSGQVDESRSGRVARASFSMAFAAAVVALFVILPVRRNPADNTVAGDRLLSEAAELDGFAVMPSAGLEKYMDGGMLPENVNGSGLLAIADKAVAEDLQESAGDEVLAGENVVETREEAPKAVAPEGRTRRKVQEGRAEEDVPDFFEEEDYRPVHNYPAEVYAQGSLGGNDSGVSFRAVSGTFAPGRESTGIVETGKSVYGVPLSVGIGVRKYFMPRLSLGVGLDYTRLSRTFTGKYVEDGTSGEAGTVQHIVQYVGIPLKLFYDVLSTDRIKFYVNAGGEAEVCVSSRYTLFAAQNLTMSEPVKKLQYSVGAGVGVEFMLSRNVGVYVDPSIKYYFPCDQPKSVRTERPLLVNFDAGVRYSF